MRLHCVAVLTALASSTSAATVARAAPEPANAGCLIRSGDEVLLVRDVWSQRWGLPGGGHELGEAPGETAARETWEETGLRVVPVTHLGTTPGGFQAWGCMLEGPVAMVGRHSVALPAHARGEVPEARFLDPRRLSPADLRFPSQAADLRRWAATAPSVPATMLRPRPAPEVGPMAGALWLSRALAAPQVPPVRAALGLASGLAALPAIALMVAWLAGWAGWRQAAELLLMTSFATFSAAIIKDLLALPRPGDLDVAFATTMVRGFGFPSGHAAVATCLWGALAARTRLTGSRLAAAVAIFLCCLARVALGAHFIHDVLGGVALAGAGVLLHDRALSRRGAAWLPARTWAALWAGAVAAAVAIRSIGPDQVMALGATLGCVAAARWAPRAQSPGGALWRPSPSGDDRLGAAAAAALLIIGTAAGGALAAPREATFIASLVHRAGLALALGAALPLGAALSSGRRHAPAEGAYDTGAAPVAFPPARLAVHRSDPPQEVAGAAPFRRRG